MMRSKTNILESNSLFRNIKISEPWQGQLYAITLAIIDANIFSYKDFLSVFSKKLDKKVRKNNYDSDIEFFFIWLETLETLLCSLEIGKKTELMFLKDRWRNAFKRTKHGEPVKLLNIATDSKQGLTHKNS